MFVGITNTPRDYAWGSTGEISALLGTEPTGSPEAELWLGAHPGSPTRIIDPSQTGGAADLVDWIAADPATALGIERSGIERAADERMPQLTFLLKVLAAGHPLSIQAHPDLDQARAGFARENNLGVAADDPRRNYKDDNHKPELIFALSDRFEALCGFRPVAESAASFDRLLELDAASGSPDPVPWAGMRERLRSGDVAGAFGWVLSGGDDVDELVARVSALVGGGGFDTAAGGLLNRRAETEWATAALETAALLAREWPGDPGIVVSLLMNRVTLQRGEALYLPAGNIHAYLEGVGIELMSASDNVLRGGLTPKHVDVPELLSVVDFTTGEVPQLEPVALDGDAVAYRPGVPDFQLVVVTGDTSVRPAGASIAVCTSGEFTVTGASSTVTIGRGDAVFVTPDEGELHWRGAGEAFLATAQ